ncbi:MAG TPA: hypothetical protein VF185_03575 [Patescibacteria group bacterium]
MKEKERALPLNYKDLLVLRFIWEGIGEKGYPPTMEELKEKLQKERKYIHDVLGLESVDFGSNSKSIVYKCIQKLEENDMVTCNYEKRKARAIIPLVPSVLPLVGTHNLTSSEIDSRIQAYKRNHKVILPKY